MRSSAKKVFAILPLVLLPQLIGGRVFERAVSCLAITVTAQEQKAAARGAGHALPNRPSHELFTPHEKS